MWLRNIKDVYRLHRTELDKAPEPRAMPKHSGNATKNTTTEDGKSDPAFFK